MQKTDKLIVLAEDDDGHARLMEKNLRRAGLTTKIVRCKNGRDALELIQNRAAEASLDIKNTILLLDLNMPIMDGKQVLKELKAREKTRNIPVVVLTTTDDSREVNRCYELGCNVYISKPVDYEEFSKAIVNLGMFLSVLTLPNGSNEISVCNSPT